jgi:hypothetical protein
MADEARGRAGREELVGSRQPPADLRPSLRAQVHHLALGRRLGAGVDHGEPSGRREDGLGRAVSRDDPEEHAVGEGVDGGARRAVRLVDLVLAHHGPGPVHDEDLDGRRRGRRRPGRMRRDRDQRLGAEHVGPEVTGRVDLDGEIQAGCRSAIHRRRHPLECVAQ